MYRQSKMAHNYEKYGTSHVQTHWHQATCIWWFLDPGIVACEAEERKRLTYSHLFALFLLRHWGR